MGNEDLRDFFASRKQQSPIYWRYAEREDNVWEGGLTMHCITHLLHKISAVAFTTLIYTRSIWKQSYFDHITYLRHESFIVSKLILIRNMKNKMNKFLCNLAKIGGNSSYRKTFKMLV